MCLLTLRSPIIMSCPTLEGRWRSLIDSSARIWLPQLLVSLQIDFTRHQSTWGVPNMIDGVNESFWLLIFFKRLKMKLYFLSRLESTPPSLHPFYNFDNKLISNEIFLQFGKQTVRFVRKLKSVHKLWAFKFHGFDMRFCSLKYFYQRLSANRWNRLLLEILLFTLSTFEFFLSFSRYEFFVYLFYLKCLVRNLIEVNR